MLVTTLVRNTVCIFLFTFLITNLSFSQKSHNDHFIYFDENYIEITKEEFQNKRRNSSLLEVEGDSIHHRILSVRQESGYLQKRSYLDSLLTKSSNKQIDSSKPLVIIYYPGKDPCNSSGSATAASKRRWFKQMQKGIHKLKESNIIYVYKEIDGLYIKKGKYQIKWIKDPDHMVEKLFFKKHYPCSSFVIISEQSYFISYFGEFGKDMVWNTMELLINFKPDEVIKN